MNADEPAITVPTGVDSPLEKQRETESKREQYCLSVIFSATTACHNRAPINWSGSAFWEDTVKVQLDVTFVFAANVI